MKTFLPTLALLTLSPLAVVAQSTDAMPPETKAPAPSGSMEMPAKPPVKPSTQLVVSLAAGMTPVTYTPAELVKLPQQTVTAVDGHTGKTVTFTGPLVADVLAKAGLPSTEVSHRRILNSFVIATGTDGYRVVYSLAEMEPLFSSGKVIVALTADGAPVASGLQLVNPLDTKPARWVHGVTALSVTTVTPK